MMPHEQQSPERLLKKYNVEGRNLKLASTTPMSEWDRRDVGDLSPISTRRAADKRRPVRRRQGWIQDRRGLRTTRGWFAQEQDVAHARRATPVMIRWPGHTKRRYDDLVSTSTWCRRCDGVWREPPKEMTGLN